MQRKALLTLIIVLFATTFSSCSSENVTPAIILDFETEHNSDFSALSENYPLPEEIAVFYSDLPTDTPEDTYELLARITLTSKKPMAPSVQLSQNSFLLNSRYYVPAVPFWDPRNNVKREHISETQLLPLEELALPNKALSVDGNTIESPDYPLISKEFVELVWNEAVVTQGDKDSIVESVAALSHWFEKVKEHFQTTPSSPPKIVWIGAVGDIMVQRGVQEILIRQGEKGLRRVFQNTLPILQSQDLMIGNLEGAVTRRGAPVPKSYNFRFSPEVLPPLSDAGFDYFSITNNHCYDYGGQGFVDTLVHLKEHGLLTSGAGEDPASAYAPVKVTIKNTAVSVLSVGAYGREKNGFDGRRQAQVTDNRPGIIFSGPRVLDTIQRTSNPNAIDVIVAHGGEEWTSKPRADQKSFYRSCIDAGADIVFAHHPHVLQGMEAYGGGLIAYSLGNFIFPGMYVMQHAEESLILSAGFHDSRIVYIKPYPVRIDNRVIALDDPEGPILPRFLELTKQLN